MGLASFLPFFCPYLPAFWHFDMMRLLTPRECRRHFDFNARCTDILISPRRLCTECLFPRAHAGFSRDHCHCCIAKRHKLDAHSPVALDERHDAENKACDIISEFACRDILIRFLFRSMRFCRAHIMISRATHLKMPLSAERAGYKHYSPKAMSEISRITRYYRRAKISLLMPISYRHTPLKRWAFRL